MVQLSGRPKTKTSLRTLIFWQVVLLLVSYASYYLRGLSDSLLLYLPTALSIVLIHWYGWRVLLIVYINAIATLIIWNAPGPPWRILLISTHEPLVAFASKLLVDRFIKVDSGEFFKSTRLFSLFIFYGIVIPISLNSIYVYNYTFINKDLEQVALFWFSDLITILAVAVPLLHFLKPSNTLFITTNQAVPRFSSSQNFIPTRESVEFIGVLLFFIVFYLVMPFDQYWYVYWIGAVIVALRQGFERVILLSLAIFFITYILPLIEVLPDDLTNSSTQRIPIHLGAVTMMFMAMLVGRVVSDWQASEAEIVQQNEEIEKANRKLRKANEELDRFVYSASHDLSAPLKSIKGLIAISKMEPAEVPTYLDKMEKSVDKLEDFITEVLDYSRTSRKELEVEPLKLTILFKEILEKFNFLEGYNSIRFETDFKVDIIHSDKFLIKVILGNLVSNSIKYQKTGIAHEPCIVLSSSESNGQVQIIIRDNGEGIEKEHQEKIFQMFYRGTMSSSGSGLGLYIAREAANKLNGTLNLNSVVGKGTTATLTLQKAYSE